MANGMNFEKAEQFRATDPKSMGQFATKAGDEFGIFFVRLPWSPTTTLKVMVAPSDSRWQHISVSHKNRIPTWEEMCFIKNLFWDEDVTVVQFHPKKAEYVNIHDKVLHMWRDTSKEHELPPRICV